MLSEGEDLWMHVGSDLHLVLTTWPLTRKRNFSNPSISVTKEPGGPMPVIQAN